LPAKTAIDEAEIAASGGASGTQLAPIHDGRFGPSSEHRPTPRFVWPGTTGGKGWIECRWTEPRGLDRAAVYWAVDRRAQVYWGKRIRGEDLALPESWRILYKDGEEWKPVTALAPDGDPWVMDKDPSPYTLRLDVFNEVRFQPLTTTALRLEVDFAAAPCAVQEWRVSHATPR
jgi:hypothetical protein